MARVTVEDCIVKIPNRFELIMLASLRARELSKGAELSLDRDNDKNPVVGLREIADETVELDKLEASLIRGLQKHGDVEELDEEPGDLLIEEDLMEAAAGPGVNSSADDTGTAGTDEEIAAEIDLESAENLPALTNKESESLADDVETPENSDDTEEL